LRLGDTSFPFDKEMKQKSLLVKLLVGERLSSSLSLTLLSFGLQVLNYDKILLWNKKNNAEISYF